jgi:uncharacterized protein (DUF1778 family)
MPGATQDDRSDQRVSSDLKVETLTLRDWEAFLAALDATDRPRPRLVAAARRYRSRRERDVD